MSSQAALELVIGLTDNASGPLKKLAGGLSTLGKIGGTALLGGAVAGVGALSAALVTGIADAREAAKVMAQTEAVIKSTGGAAGFTADQIADMAGSLSAASGKSLFGDDDIQRGQNMLLTFTNIKETLPDATQVMLDMATAMGTDAEAGAIQLGKALNDPVAGISALSRVGVTFTEDQKEVIASLVETGDVAGAQRVILAELNKEFGGSAAAAAAADGGFAQFRDRMGELAESVGARVLPALNGLMGWLNSPEVMGAIEGFVTGLVGGFTSVYNIFNLLATGDFSGGIFGLSEDHPIIGALTTIHDTVSNVVAAFNLWKTWGVENGIAGAIQAIGDKFPVLQPFTDWLQNVIPVAGQKTREVFGLARDSVTTFVDALQGDWKADPEKIHPLHEAIGEFGLMIHDEGIPAVTEWIKWLKEEIPKAAATFKLSVNEDLLPAIKLVSDALNKQGNEDLPKAGNDWKIYGLSVETVLNDTMNGMIELGDSARNGLTQMSLDGRTWALGWSVRLALWVIDWRNAVIDAVAEMAALPAKLATAVGSLAGTLKQAGIDLIQGLIDGMRSLNPGSILSGIVTGAVAAARAAIQSKSPSKVTRDQLGKPMGEGIVVGIESTAESVKQAVGKTVLGAIQVATLAPEAKKSGKAVAEAFKSGLSEGLEDTENLKQIFGGKLRNAVEVAAEDVKQIFGGKLRAALAPELDAVGEYLARVMLAGFNRVVGDFKFGQPDMVFVPGPGHADSPPSPKGDRSVTPSSTGGYQTLSTQNNNVSITITTSNSHDAEQGVRKALMAAGLM